MFRYMESVQPTPRFLTRMELSPKGALAGLIAVSAAIRLLLAGSLGPGNDEAYHYLFTLHPAGGYFDHPPMLAWVERIGLVVASGAPNILAMRLGFIAMFAGSTWILARLTNRLFPDQPWSGFWAGLALNLTAYYGVAAATFALPDGPLLFFWLLTLDRLAEAAALPDSWSRWAAVGVAWGFALLSKYHAVFLPAGAVLFALIHRPARGWLVKPGPWLAAGLGLAIFSPVIVWNASHGWASFVFQGGRASADARWQPWLLGLAMAEQAGYLLPWIWFPLVLCLIAAVRASRGAGAVSEKFLLSQAVIPLALFAVVAMRGRVLPHWSLIGLVAMFPLLGVRWATRRAADPRKFVRKLAAPVIIPPVLILLVVAQARWDWLSRVGLARFPSIAKSADPTLDLKGWADVARILEQRGYLDQPRNFLMTTRWYQTGQLAFAAGAKLDSACFSPYDARGFAYWSKRDEWVGRDAILVTIDDMETDPRHFRRWFDSVEPIDKVVIERGGEPVRSFGIFLCRRQRGPYPFANLTPAEIKRRSQVAQALKAGNASH